MFYIIKMTLMPFKSIKTVHYNNVYIYNIEAHLKSAQLILCYHHKY